MFLYQRKQNLFNANIEQLKSEKESQILKAQLEIQEETLLKVSKEIHDNIGLSLTVAKLNASSLIENDPLNEKLVMVHNLISDGIRDLREISHSLNSNLILNNGLINTIENEIGYINLIGTLKIKFTYEGDSKFLTAAKELVIYRVIQEALQNILKHSNAKEGNLIIKFLNDNIEIFISDNGVGFDINCENKTSLGINNMKTRIEYLNGKFEIDSKKFQGTSINIKVPY